MTQVVVERWVWRAELTVGTKRGYTGTEVVTPADIIPLVQEYQKDTDPWYAVIVWTRGTVLGPTFPPETVIKVTLENNPLYTPNAKYEDVRDYVTSLAALLAEKLHQIRVYVGIYSVRSLIVDTSV